MISMSKEDARRLGIKFNKGGDEIIAMPKGEFLLKGKPAVIDAYPGAGTTLWLGALNNDAMLEYGENGSSNVRIVGDPTEGALLVAAAKVGGLQDMLSSAYPRVQEIPFDSTRKRMVTFHELRHPRREDLSPFDESAARNNVIVLKGAPDVVLDLCTKYEDIHDRSHPLTAEMRAAILAANDAMTEDALRVLAVAYALVDAVPESVEEGSEHLERDLIFAGLIGMIDPPRPEVKAALAKVTSTKKIAGGRLRTSIAI
jgi:Ca2+-transporting ATPase